MYLVLDDYNGEFSEHETEAEAVEKISQLVGNEDTKDYVRVYKATRMDFDVSITLMEYMA